MLLGWLGCLAIVIALTAIGPGLSVIAADCHRFNTVCPAILAAHIAVHWTINQLPQAELPTDAVVQEIWQVTAAGEVAGRGNAGPQHSG